MTVRIEFGDPPSWPRPQGPLTSRIAYAAAHVAADPLGENAPGAPAVIDWDATLGFRRHLWSWGLGVAEAMDTAQRGMGLDWDATRELIQRSAAEAATARGLVVAGASTDHLAPTRLTLAHVIGAYEQQLEFVEGTGAGVVLMASRHLAACAAGPDDYHTVYSRLLRQVSRPVILHWLGAGFDPALAGYWGSTDSGQAAETVLAIATEFRHSVAGIKLSLLDSELEVELRRKLPPGVRMYTGDDYHYAELIRGADGCASDALLGVFAAIAPAASAALQALARGDLHGYDEALLPTVPLARHLFGSPTQYYKVGIAFLAWLAGHQPGFTMVGGLHSGRSVPHLLRTAELAAAAHVLPDPELAASRLRALLAVAGLFP